MGNTPSIVIKQELFTFAKEGNDTELMKLLSEHPKQINSKEGETGNTILHYAAAKGLLALCEALLGVDGVDPNVSNKSGTTPLVLAAGNGKVELVDALLADSRVDVNLVCDAGITALHTAVLKGRSAVVVALLKHPTLDPNVNTTLKGDTPVHLAAGGHGKRRHKMLRLLLADPRTDSNVVNSQGVKAAVPRQVWEAEEVRAAHPARVFNNTKSKPASLPPLMLDAPIPRTPPKKTKAAAHKRERSSSKGSETGSDNAREVSRKDELLEMMASMAEEEAEDDVSSELLERQFSLYIPSSTPDLPNVPESDKARSPPPKPEKEMEPARRAALDQRLAELCQIAVDSDEADERIIQALGEDPELINWTEQSTGNNLLHYAAAKDKPELCKALLQVEGINPNICNKYGATPLVLAAGNGLSNIVSILIDSELVDVNMVASSGMTALHMAARRDLSKVVRLILAAPRADPNVRDKDYDTPLHVAARKDRQKAVAELLSDPRTSRRLRNAAGELPELKDEPEALDLEGIPLSVENSMETIVAVDQVGSGLGVGWTVSEADKLVEDDDDEEEEEGWADQEFYHVDVMLSPSSKEKKKSLQSPAKVHPAPGHGLGDHATSLLQALEKVESTNDGEGGGDEEDADDGPAKGSKGGILTPYASYFTLLKSRVNSALPKFLRGQDDERKARAKKEKLMRGSGREPNAEEEEEMLQGLERVEDVEAVCTRLEEFARASAKGVQNDMRTGSAMKVIEAMRKHIENVVVQRWGAAALENLARAKKEENVESVGDVGGIEAVITAMSRHISTITVQQSGLRALINMTDTSARQ
ncbi:hypothetical protein CYMTET_21486, partial [Cymbomonas tetramitiformis]